MKLLDTTFLIHLQRERARKEEGPARRLLKSEPEEAFGISVVSVVEFLEGYDRPSDGVRFLEPFERFELTEAIALVASRVRRDLRARGEMIGDFDILLASTCLAVGIPLVSDNARHFERIGGLTVEGYR